MKSKDLNQIDNIDDLDSEEIIFVLKQSPSFFGRIFLVIIIALILIFVSFYYFGASKITSYLIFTALIIISYLFLFYYYRWSRTLYILTDQRIISQRQKGWLTKIVDETNLDSIRFVSHSVKGLSQYVLNTGNVFIRSSVVESGGLKIENIANPYEVQKKIVEIQKKYTSKEAESMSEKEFKKETKKGPVIR